MTAGLKAGSESEAGVGRVLKLDPALDAFVPRDARIEKVAGGFTFTEGPLWRPDGVLWFSDVIGNVVRQWSPTGGVTELFRPGGYDGTSLPAGGFVGPNGMTAGPDGAAILCQHGNRRVVRIDADMSMSTVVDAFETKRLNSPNDVVSTIRRLDVLHRPSLRAPAGDSDPEKDLPFNGVYRLAGGRLQLVVADMTRPNGLAFSPDEKTLYVANSDPDRRIWMRYDVAADGSLHGGRVFADVTPHDDAGLPDGLKIDAHGNLFATGPGGVWVFTPAARTWARSSSPSSPPIADGAMTIGARCT